MPDGLSNRLKYAFILQAAMAVLAIVMGALAVSAVAVDELSKRSLQEEAAYFWARHARDPQAQPPDTRVLQGFFVPAGTTEDGVPMEIRGLTPGPHSLDEQHSTVLVATQPAGRLYLQYNTDRLWVLAFWLVLAPVLIAIIAILASTWYTYHKAKRAVQPVDWLAQEVSRWDPREPDTNALAPDRLPPDSGRETRQLAGALQRMAERTRAFVRRERDFTRDSSHELRTPLTVIRVASDMLLEDPELPARASRSLQRIQRAGRDMEALIDAFLILAREADIEPQREDFDVRDVVYEEVEKTRTLLQARPVQVTVVEDANPRLFASPRVLAVMLGNLLRNACSFTEQGEIVVRIGEDRVQVRDTGIGMDAETLRRAFDPFYRGEGAGPAGKGMGLSIVHRLGERFGWPVGIESEPGLGTTVTIRFNG